MDEPLHCFVEIPKGSLRLVRESRQRRQGSRS